MLLEHITLEQVESDEHRRLLEIPPGAMNGHSNIDTARIAETVFFKDYGSLLWHLKNIKHYGGIHWFIEDSQHPNGGRWNSVINRSLHSSLISKIERQLGQNSEHTNRLYLDFAVGLGQWDWAAELPGKLEFARIDGEVLLQTALSPINYAESYAWIQKPLLTRPFFHGVYAHDASSQHL
jgi:hypothetical protein